MQHLDRRLEHLDEFEDALVGAVQAAGIGVGIGVVLGERFQLANVDLADQRGDVLIVLVAGLGFRNRDLPQPRGLNLGDAESRNIASESFEPLVAPRTHQPTQAPARDAVLLFEHRAELLRIEQAERGLEHRTELVTGFEHIDGMDLRSEEHTSELQSQSNLVCRLLLEKKKKTKSRCTTSRTLRMAPAMWTFDVFCLSLF